MIEASILLLDTLRKHGSNEEVKRFADDVMPIALTHGDENLIRSALNIIKK